MKAGRTFVAEWKIAEVLWKRAMIQLPKLILKESSIPGLHNKWGLFTLYDIDKGKPLTFYGGLAVPKSFALALRKERKGWHSHMKGIGMASSEDTHVLIGHCTEDMQLFYFLVNHFMGSFINTNKNTGLKPNVKEVVLDQHFIHPPPNKDHAHVSKMLLYLTAIFVCADTELLSSYDEGYWRETEALAALVAKSKKRVGLPKLPPLPPASARDQRYYAKQGGEAATEREMQRQMDLIAAREAKEARKEKKQQAEALAREESERQDREREEKQKQEAIIAEEHRQERSARVRKPPVRLENESEQQQPYARKTQRTTESDGVEDLTLGRTCPGSDPESHSDSDSD